MVKPCDSMVKPVNRILLRFGGAQQFAVLQGTPATLECGDDLVRDEKATQFQSVV